MVNPAPQSSWLASCQTLTEQSAGEAQTEQWEEAARGKVTEEGEEEDHPEKEV